jgi:protein-arginine kinase activator protein McsA
VRQRYEIGRTLPEQLDDAVKAEDYELAAKIRDRIRNGEKVSADGTGDGADAVEH